ncbi:KEX1 [Symbiodinium necroappetens]|uniref:Carboxypeptidase n=1 Tax=Symbiodinium necroappetens TaxID=1628268 RepID=A0A813BF59_9DINO|nr:KEX1 [Symbiodinium necroappetens]
MYSGYVNVTRDDYLFYWFFEAMEPEASSPVIVWGNGGPGCTSMEGAATEIGPLVLDGVKTSSRFSGKLSYNKYAWNRRAHVLIVDQPRYVGFSTGRGHFVNSSAQAGLDMVQFLLGWQALFPEILSPKFVLAGESYAGHFVPAWAKAVADYNRNSGDLRPIGLAGIALSSACIDDDIQNLDTFVAYSKQSGLLPEYAAPHNMWEASEQMALFLKYRPNQYDHTLPDKGPCCGYTFGGCAGGCISLPSGFDKGPPFGYTSTLSDLLDWGIPVLLMYGMRDLTCDYVGGYAVASSLRWERQNEFSSAPMESFQTFGQKQSGGGLTFVQIEEAGHMCPADKPEASSYAVDLLLDAIAVNGESEYLRQFKRQPSAASRLHGHGIWTMMAMVVSGLVLSSLLVFFGLRLRSTSISGELSKEQEHQTLARSPSEAKCLLSALSSAEDLSVYDDGSPQTVQA